MKDIWNFSGKLLLIPVVPGVLDVVVVLEHIQHLLHVLSVSLGELDIVLGETGIKKVVFLNCAFPKNHHFYLCMS